MRGGRGVDPEMKVEEGVTKGKTRIGKRVLLCERGECEGKRVGRSLEKSPK